MCFFLFYHYEVAQPDLDLNPVLYFNASKTNSFFLFAAIVQWEHRFLKKEKKQPSISMAMVSWF